MASKLNCIRFKFGFQFWTTKSVLFESDDKIGFWLKFDDNFQWILNHFWLNQLDFDPFLNDFDPFSIKIWLILIHFLLKYQLNDLKYQINWHYQWISTFSMDFIIFDGFWSIFDGFQSISEKLTGYWTFWLFGIWFNQFHPEDSDSSYKFGSKIVD